jgi:phosphate starvation-inducible PhoH-like protein
MGVTRKNSAKKQIQEGIEEYNANKRRRTGITMEEFKKTGIELTPKQDQLFKGIRTNTLSIVHGPAGSSKTFLACYSALYLLANKEVERIILTKPIKESGEELGFLPGTVAEKVEPFMKSYISNFEKIIGPQATSFLLSTGEITIEPLAYMRGSTYDWSVMLLDEAQNSTLTQLMLWSTRLGKESRMVLMGDTSQYDVREKDSGLRTFIEMTNGMDGLLNFEFSNQDIVRNKFLIELTDRYDRHRFKK